MNNIYGYKTGTVCHDSLLTLCPKQPDSDYHKTSVDRKCDACGTKPLTIHLLPLLDDETKKSQPVSWNKCEIVKQGGYARLTKVKKDGTFEELVNVLVHDLESSSCHLFNAKYSMVLVRNPCVHGLN